AEFPGNLGKDNESQLLENLSQLDKASERPWVLLSAGVDFPDYKRQVELAVRSGASGVLGGRAFWKEFFQHDGPQAREKFARNDAAGRVRQINEIVQRQATPWFVRYGLQTEDFPHFRAVENWHSRYGDGRAASGKASAGVEGEVY